MDFLFSPQRLVLLLLISLVANAAPPRQRISCSDVLSRIQLLWQRTFNVPFTQEYEGSPQKKFGSVHAGGLRSTGAPGSSSKGKERRRLLRFQEPADVIPVEQWWREAWEFWENLATDEQVEAWFVQALCESGVVPGFCSSSSSESEGASPTELDEDAGDVSMSWSNKGTSPDSRADRSGKTVVPPNGVGGPVQGVSSGSDKQLPASAPEDDQPVLSASASQQRSSRRPRAASRERDKQKSSINSALPAPPARPPMNSPATQDDLPQRQKGTERTGTARPGARIREPTPAGARMRRNSQRTLPTVDLVVKQDIDTVLAELYESERTLSLRHTTPAGGQQGGPRRVSPSQEQHLLRRRGRGGGAGAPSTARIAVKNGSGTDSRQERIGSGSRLVEAARLRETTAPANLEAEIRMIRMSTKNKNERKREVEKAKKRHSRRALEERAAAGDHVLAFAERFRAKESLQWVSGFVLGCMFSHRLSLVPVMLVLPMLFAMHGSASFAFAGFDYLTGNPCADSYPYCVGRLYFFGEYYALSVSQVTRFKCALAAELGFRIFDQNCVWLQERHEIMDLAKSR